MDGTTRLGVDFFSGSGDGADVLGCPGALGRYLAGMVRQFGPDPQREVQVRRVAGQFLQALGDQRGGLGDVTASLGDLRAQSRADSAGIGLPSEIWAQVAVG